MQIALISLPGTNCERETALAVQRAGMEPVEFLWNHSPNILVKFDGFIVCGGFSYEDRVRAGRIAAFAPIISALHEQDALGKPILGICNGAQILVEAGFVPGLQNNQLAMALTENKRVDASGNVLGTGFYNAWVHIKHSQGQGAFTCDFKEAIKIPAAHAEGRFVMEADLLKELLAKNVSVIQYCDKDGVIDNHFPINPNGSMHNIAGIGNARGNVLALMPHPERVAVGDVIFSSMRKYIQSASKPSMQSISYQTQAPEILKHQSNAEELIVGMQIFDNIEVSLQSALKQLNMPVQVTRHVHWELGFDNNNDESLREVIESLELFNPNKEYLLEKSEVLSDCEFSLLVREREDFLGQKKCQMLRKRFDVENLKQIKHSVLWSFKCDKSDVENIKSWIVDNHVIANPYAHEILIYE